MKWTDALEAAVMTLWWKSEKDTEKKMVQKKAQYADIIENLQPHVDTARSTFLASKEGRGKKFELVLTPTVLKNKIDSIRQKSAARFYSQSRV